jgi:hypothetical protein
VITRDPAACQLLQELAASGVRAPFIDEGDDFASLPVVAVPGVLVQIFEGRQTEPVSTSPYAASTASHTCRIMAPGLVISDVSNCPFLILFANSIPLKVTSAFPNVLNPSIG